MEVNTIHIKEKFHILLVEDSNSQGQYFKDCLEEIKQNTLKVTWVKDMSSALQILQNEEFDTILPDLNLPDSMGTESFFRMYSSSKSIPIIILTVIENEDTVIDLLGKGAKDYFVKKDVKPRALYRTIHYSIYRKRAEEELEKSGFFSPGSSSLGFSSKVSIPSFVRDGTMEDFYIPGFSGISVKYDQVTERCSTFIHILGCLFQSFLDCFLQIAISYLQFQNHFLNTIFVRPDNQQIGSHPSQTVLSADISATVQNALQKSLK